MVGLITLVAKKTLGLVTGNMVFFDRQALPALDEYISHFTSLLSLGGKSLEWTLGFLDPMFARF